ncbi:hypothetical protein C8Q73DRAFT_680303 [Cubamyces lactineus]|nr:hypothetical protein C8Q73DRAFT_680303 [Cubamyces lactineus]
MVSPNRHGHIVAPRPETRMYGKYRNITPHREPTSTPPANQHPSLRAGGLSRWRGGAGPRRSLL